MQIRALAFDIDGTMYLNSRMYLRSALFALGNWRLLSALQKARNHMRDKGYEGDFYPAQARLTAANLGRDAAWTARLIEERVYHTWELSLQGITLAPGFRESLDKFRAMGLKMGVLSDFPVARKLHILGVPEGWDASLSTEEVGRLKPDPRGFVELADRLGVGPSEILYVGNSYSYDVLGAKAAGMRVAHFAPRPRPATVADLTFRHYGQLVSWVGEQRTLS